ncbi:MULTISPECIES: dihydrolipoamide acetyltransferase family protein [Mesonia]|uniref:Dihydrolipoyllysine-residue acetyltransferase component of pyruvate dehydrogenase complex n=1 Tax=Mesonia oceanica TaxID=2687242 RepID=A0AC61YBY4_9FLAO|nr:MULTISPECIES: dihydrolipoamide acetyltransferase family protein [Mesonia]MAN29233.1 diapophytoene dehydrogenase [Mesonia sp.]MAQ39943.1 diapophytoene dehydrogenase [Mesonia sp.]MBJ99076.1 diapophytoene dehydrogenase [Flavobacteriaceae bacterium]VVV02011.1 Dihydrolipoyllysine-residue acetyltransferase component of pyruvate dehydrogenase complex [Mesonia oceanica]|tara:strand:- start:65665 stop:66966 length:1302 start_codon:yes stop_codon:yes gene_type:complete
MARFELKLPKMGESVAEATITNWLKEVGDTIEEDEAVLEIATDKVDSEVPSEVDGVLVEKLFEPDDVVQVGQTIAIIETEGEVEQSEATTSTKESSANVAAVEETVSQAKATASNDDYSDSERFYSPLVKNIAKEENIGLDELENVKGTGKDGRVTKDDILAYVKNRGQQQPQAASKPASAPQKAAPKPTAAPISVNGEDEIIEMTRMGKMISHHMVNSVQTSAHVQSFIEVDVTKIWNWRNKVKNEFAKREGEKLTFTPIFMEAVAKAIKDFPLINISVDGDKIIKRKNINLGMAAALPDGNLIVPVIHNADQLNLVGLAKKVNDLANRARGGKLKPDETQGGTYTVTNVGTFGSVLGTPIINQPQVGILALGAIRKVPAVIETPEGDFIGIRHKMFLSHSYDHRVVNGALGGQFVQRVAQYLEAFDEDRDF